MITYKKSFFLVLVVPLLHGCLAVIAGGAAADSVHDRRGFRTVIDDRNIQLTAMNLINRDKDLVRGNYRIKVVVYNGVTLICGQASSADLKQRAEATVKNVQGIARVVNEIQVIDEPEGFWRRRQDNALNARVKTGMLDLTSMPGFDPTRINVTTSHHVVYLMGMVSHEEADAVADIARDVGGVEKVVKVFEYTD